MGWTRRYLVAHCVGQKHQCHQRKRDKKQPSSTLSVDQIVRREREQEVRQPIAPRIPQRSQTIRRNNLSTICRSTELIRVSEVCSRVKRKDVDAAQLLRNHYNEGRETGSPCAWNREQLTNTLPVAR